MNREFTRTGALKLGKLIRRSLEDQGWTQKELVARLESETGHVTSEYLISRLITASKDAPSAMLVLSIADMGFVKKPNGEPYCFRELMLIACEEIDPETGKEISTHRKNTESP